MSGRMSFLQGDVSMRGIVIVADRDNSACLHRGMSRRYNGNTTNNPNTTMCERKGSENAGHRTAEIFGWIPETGM